MYFTNGFMYFTSNSYLTCVYFVGISGDHSAQEGWLGVDTICVPKANRKVDKEANLHRDQGVYYQSNILNSIHIIIV